LVYEISSELFLADKRLLILEKESKQDNGFAVYGKSDTFRLYRAMQRNTPRPLF